MKKIAKISLVAAIAVAGFTTANAQPLEEAIKNVDVTGSVVYRYNDYRNNSETADLSKDVTNNNYKVALALSSKINEDLKFNSRFLVSSATGDFASLATADGGDGNVNVTLSNANFAYSGLKNTTVTVGKQGLATPWTVAVQADGNEQTGTGALALTTVGPVTLAGAYFNQTNLGTSGNGLPTTKDTKVNGVAIGQTASDDANSATGSSDIAAIAAIAAVGPVTLDAWYLDMKDTFDTYTLGAKYGNTVAGIKIDADARYASLNLDASDLKNDMAKLVLVADAGLVDGKLAYATTNKEGGLTALDNDATTTLLGWNLTSNGKADANYWQAVLGFDILSNLNLSANYGNLKYIASAGSTTDVEEEEVYGQLLYTMSKNLTTYVRYGTYSKETTVAGAAAVKDNDDTRGRLQVKYTF